MNVAEKRFFEDFESGELPANKFHHRDHIRLAWIYLREFPVTEALGRFASGLRRFAEVNSQPRLYHETITWTFLLAIHERMAICPHESFETFAADNQDLFDWPSPLLERYYRKETLSSELAKRVFVLPDRSSA